MSFNDDFSFGRGSSVIDEEYRYYRSIGFSPIEAKNKAIDYWRRYTRREVSFDQFDDQTFHDSITQAQKVETNQTDFFDLLHKIVNTLHETTDDIRVFRLLSAMIKLFEIDLELGAEKFDFIPGFDEVDTESLTPNKLRHNKLAPVCGFPTGDKALKAYHHARWILQETLKKCGVEDTRFFRKSQDPNETATDAGDEDFCEDEDQI